jgi:hypothetical protein
MMTGTAIVAIVASLGWLILNYRALQSYGLSFRKKLQMAGAWVIIIAGLAFVLSRIAA